MRRLLYDVQALWREKLAFRIATLYLLLFIVLAFTVPWLPLPYAPGYLDLFHLFQPPFVQATDQAIPHWLGTDALGRDVLTEVLYGARTGLLMSVPVVLIANLAGIALGSAAGYFGDNRLHYKRSSLLLWLLLLFAFIYLVLYVPLHLQKLALHAGRIWISLLAFTLVGIATWLFLRPLLLKLPWAKHSRNFPLDACVIRVIEIVSSVPWLILILLLASFMPPSVMLLSVVLTLSSWTHTARLVRAEMLGVKAMPYMEAGYSLGFSDAQLLIRQALPNILGPALVAFSFTLAGLLTLESTLSFLGIGLPPTIISWGRTIAGIRSNTSAWWLVVFPGGFLALTVLALQTFSYYMLKSMRKERS
ncbi:ABC transporter permease [Pontibacter chitinilyticus]|uniref:ABC transporter permease n=1 Tax=Pontibacter chitinilyticus TaxID=2674989 RepID=UPI003219D8FB